MSRHIVPKLEVYKYALQGAVTERGVQSGAMSDEYAEQLDKDIEYLEKRVEELTAKEARK